jgi:hypothetical protein
MSIACNIENIPKEMNTIERERAKYANKVYCKACEDTHIKICSWENSPAWQEYVAGKIEESQLAERAREELGKFSETFSKYTVVKEEDTSPSKDEEVRRDRAKVANKIYKQVCTDSGRSNCFFSNFGTWSDYVQGKMNESDFAEKAMIEVIKMADTPQ